MRCVWMSCTWLILLFPGTWDSWSVTHRCWLCVCWWWWWWTGGTEKGKLTGRKEEGEEEVWLMGKRRSWHHSGTVTSYTHACTHQYTHTHKYTHTLPGVRGQGSCVGGQSNAASLPQKKNIKYELPLAQNQRHLLLFFFPPLLPPTPPPPLPPSPRWDLVIYNNYTN